MSEQLPEEQGGTPPRKAPRSRHRKIAYWLAGILVLVLAALATFLGYTYFVTDHALSSIKRESMLPQGGETTPADPSAGQPINYLLMGSDDRKDGEPARSDSLMVAHIPADRRHIYLISLPRDLYVPIPGHPKQKINAAYQYGQAPLTATTVQQLLGVQMDHAALVDFDGFIKVVNGLGGVTIDNPYEGCDDSQHVCWKKGRQTLNNERALQYVRWRHGLPNGDLDRAGNQQRVLKAIVGQLLQANVLANPNTLASTITTVGKNMVLDQGLTNDTIRSTVLNMRITSSSDLRSLTVGVKDYATIKPWGDVDLLDEAKLEELKQALAQDNLEAYWVKHHNDPIAGIATVKE